MVIHFGSVRSDTFTIWATPNIIWSYYSQLTIFLVIDIFLESNIFLLCYVLCILRQPNVGTPSTNLCLVSLRYFPGFTPTMQVMSNVIGAVGTVWESSAMLGSINEVPNSGFAFSPWALQDAASIGLCWGYSTLTSDATKTSLHQKNPFLLTAIYNKLSACCWNWWI